MKLFHKRRTAYSLVEMLVTLALTSFILLAMVSLVSTILGISAVTYNRSQLREDLQNFAQEFEKDLRNADSIGACSGAYIANVSAPDTLPAQSPIQDNFSCILHSDAIYLWTACPRITPPECLANASYCDLRNTGKTMCKMLLASDTDITGTVVAQFNNVYNLEQFSVSSVRDDKGSVTTESSRKVMYFYAVVSHSNARLNIRNIIKQSLISTKNFQTELSN